MQTCVNLFFWLKKRRRRKGLSNSWTLSNLQKECFVRIGSCQAMKRCIMQVALLDQFFVFLFLVYCRCYISNSFHRNSQCWTFEIVVIMGWKSKEDSLGMNDQWMCSNKVKDVWHWSVEWKYTHFIGGAGGFTNSVSNGWT